MHILSTDLHANQPPNLTVTIVFLVLTLMGCSTQPPVVEPVNTINELIIRNDAKTSIYDVHLQVHQPRSFVNCNVILAGTSCSLSFPARPTRDDPASLSWTQRDNTYNQALRADPPPETARGQSFKVVVYILDDGFMHVRYE